MRAAVITKFGGPEVIQVKDNVPDPKLKQDGGNVEDDCVIVRVEASSFNMADAICRSGKVQAVLNLPMPDAIAGNDFAGIITAVGSKATGGFAVGDAVYGSKVWPDGRGAHAEIVPVNPSKDVIYKRPFAVTAGQAACVGIAALTAFTGLVMPGGLQKEDQPERKQKNVLVIGASGAVGSWAVLLSKRMGAKVTGIASGKNHQFLEEQLKVDAAIDYKAAPLKDQLTTKDEFDVIFDAVGGDEVWKLAPTILKADGVFVTCVGSYVIGTGVGLWQGIAMMGSMMWRGTFGARSYKQVTSQDTKLFEKLNEWLSDGSLKPVIHSTVHLKDIVESHRLSETLRSVGKTVILP